MPSLPAGREEKPLAEAAFQSFKDYLKQNKDDGSSPAVANAPSVSGKRRKVKVKKLSATTAGVSPSPTASVPSSTISDQLSYATKEQKEAISSVYGNINGDQPTRVIELDSSQIEKLLAMGKLQPSSEKGSPPVIELGRDDLERLLAEQEGALQTLSTTTTTQATQKPIISVTTTETKITENKDSETPAPASTVEPRVINKPVPEAEEESKPEVEGESKPEAITPKEKEIIHHFSISSNDNRVISKIPNKAPPSLSFEPVRPVFRPSQPISTNTVANPAPVTSFNQYVSHTDEQIPQYFTFPSNYNNNSPQPNQVSSVIKQSNFEFISAPPVSFSSQSEPLVPNNNNNNNNNNHDNNRPILSFISEPQPQPQYQPQQHHQQPHLIAHTTQPNPNHNVFNFNNIPSNNNNNSPPQQQQQQVFSSFPSSAPRPVTRRPISIPGFPQDPIPESQPQQQFHNHNNNNNNNHNNFPHFPQQGPPPPPQFQFKSQPNQYFPVSAGKFSSNGGRVEFPQGNRFQSRPTQRQPVFLPFNNAIGFPRGPPANNNFRGPFRAPSTNVNKFIAPGHPPPPPHHRHGPSSQEEFNVEESRYGPYRGRFRSRFPRKQPRWFFTGI